MATYRAVDVNHRPPQLVDSGFYSDIRFDANDSAPDYIGMHVDRGANTATNNEWKIVKLTYSGSDVTRIQIAYGNWTDRASYF